VTARAALPAWVADPALLETWTRVAARLERSGLVATGRTTVPTPDTRSRHAVADLVGRTVTGGSCRIDLAALDQRLMARAGLGVVRCAEGALGRSLVDRPASSWARSAARLEPFEAADQALRGTVLEHVGWVAQWLDALRRDGVVVRYPDPAAAMRSAVRVLVEVAAPRPAHEPTDVARTELAARVLHDAHGLDDGRPVTRLVLRALAHRAGVAFAMDAAARQAVWESVGVRADAVSSTALVLGLGWRSASLERRTAEGPVHVTAWDLARGVPVVPGGAPVLVCENPRVLEAHAERRGASRSVVCTSGRPNLVVQRVLRLLAEQGADLRYHGDFDWPGIAIAHHVMDVCGASPWLMDAAAYEQAPGFLPLEGAEVRPRWDDELGAAMRRRGVAVHEEAVLDAVVGSQLP